MNVQMIPYGKLHPKLKAPEYLKSSRIENNRILTINKEKVITRFPWPMKLLMGYKYNNRAQT